MLRLLESASQILSHRSDEGRDRIAYLIATLMIDQVHRAQLNLSLRIEAVASAQS